MKTRVSLAVGAVALSLVFVTVGRAEPDAASAEDLKRAAKKAAKMSSYAFGTKVIVQGLPMIGEPIEAKGAHADGTTHIEGSFRKRTYEGFVRDGDVVSRRGDEPWARADEGGMGAMGGGLASQARIVPHEELGDMPGKLADVEKAEKTEDVDGHTCSVYEGELTEEAAKAMIPPAAAAFGISGEVVGLARVWVDEGGVIRRYEMTAAIRTNFQGQDLEIGMNRTTSLSGIGETTIEVPAEVEELLKKGGEEEEGSEGDDSVPR